VHLTHVKVSRVLHPGYALSVDDSGIASRRDADLLAGRVTRREQAGAARNATRHRSTSRLYSSWIL
jgi:hypothetical protein